MRPDARQFVIDLNFDSVFDDPPTPGLSSLFNLARIAHYKDENLMWLRLIIPCIWNVIDTTSLFANRGVGFRAGGFNNSCSVVTVDLFNTALVSTVMGTDFAAVVGRYERFFHNLA